MLNNTVKGIGVVEVRMKSGDFQPGKKNNNKKNSYNPPPLTEEHGLQLSRSAAAFGVTHKHIHQPPVSMTTE